MPEDLSHALNVLVRIGNAPRSLLHIYKAHSDEILSKTRKFVRCVQDEPLQLGFLFLLRERYVGYLLRCKPAIRTDVINHSQLASGTVASKQLLQVSPVGASLAAASKLSDLRLPGVGIDAYL